MNQEVLDVSAFEHDAHFYGEIPILLTVKSFDLGSIRSRYIKSLGNVSGRSGSVERRVVGEGGLVSVTIGKGNIVDNELIVKLNEPRGIDSRDQDFAFSSEAAVYVVSDTDMKKVANDWFSYIHTVNFSPWEPGKLLVSSSGFDCIFEMDWRSGTPGYEWFAWEHGFRQGIQGATGKPIMLTRDRAQAEIFKSEGLDYMLIENPAMTGLPTASRAAFINSVFYDNSDPSRILATFFHEGKLFGIDRGNGVATELVGGMSRPHGGRNFGNGYLVTSTGSGEILIGESNGLTKYSLAALPGKPEALGDMEWIQNTLADENLLIAIDSNRTSFVIIDTRNRLYDMVPYDNNWAVQDAVTGTLSEDKKRLVRSIR